MIDNSIFFAKAEIYNLIRNSGGVWNDSKERPLVCCIKSTENNKLYYAIPIGNFNHRTPEAINRIYSYINRDASDIASCYYHIGNTDIKSIFFISDIIPITDTYIERDYINRLTGSVHIIKNKKLISELQRKASRILAFEAGNNNYFRQHITTVKNILLKELELDSTKQKALSINKIKELNDHIRHKDVGYHSSMLEGKHFIFNDELYRIDQIELKPLGTDSAILTKLTISGEEKYIDTNFTSDAKFNLHLQKIDSKSLSNFKDIKSK